MAKAAIEQVEGAEGKGEEEGVCHERQRQDAEQVMFLVGQPREGRGEVREVVQGEVVRRGVAVGRAEAAIEADERVVGGWFEEDRPSSGFEHARGLAPDRCRIDVHQEVLAVDEIDAGRGEREMLGVGAKGRDGGGLAGCDGSRGKNLEAALREFDSDDGRAALGEPERRGAIARAEFEE